MTIRQFCQLQQGLVDTQEGAISEKEKTDVKEMMDKFQKKQDEANKEMLEAKK